MHRFTEMQRSEFCFPVFVCLVPIMAYKQLWEERNSPAMIAYFMEVFIQWEKKTFNVGI